MSKAYQVITDKIIASLEAGVAPWKRPYTGQFQPPRNLTSQKCYRGINHFLLSLSDYGNPYWLTFKQAQGVGGNVKKGEKGMPVTFWSEVKTKDKTTGEKITIPCMRYYTVFNVTQCELPEAKIPATEDGDTREFTPIETCERIVAGFDGPPVAHDSTIPSYRPSADEVHMPAQDRFVSDEEYYSVLFHELSHSTGHGSRLSRKGITDSDGFGSDSYSREELIAEMGASFLCNHAGIANATLDNSASYIGGWLKVIKQDARLVVSAASAAQKAADLILGA